jgi:hypothetical protein
MTDDERNAKARQALYVMGGIDVAAIVLFWILKAFANDLSLAIAVLFVGMCCGSGYYVYQSRKLRPKDSP